MNNRIDSCNEIAGAAPVGEVTLPFTKSLNDIKQTGIYRTETGVFNVSIFHADDRVERIYNSDRGLAGVVYRDGRHYTREYVDGEWTEWMLKPAAQPEPVGEEVEVVGWANSKKIESGNGFTWFSLVLYAAQVEHYDTALMTVTQHQRLLEEAKHGQRVLAMEVEQLKAELLQAAEMIGNQGNTISRLQIEIESFLECDKENRSERAAVEQERDIMHREIEDAIFAHSALEIERDQLKAEVQMLRSYEAEWEKLLAQKVVLPSVTEVMNLVLDYQQNKRTNVTGTTNWAANLGMCIVDEVARLNSKPIQQATDGERNPRYEGLFDGETEEQRAARLNGAKPIQQEGEG
jgi:hypothetical protein